jgi:methyl-accepting chemotaxis protein
MERNAMTHAAPSATNGAPGALPPETVATQHRLWRPGMRLLRRLRFRGKALAISAGFLLPILLLVVSLLDSLGGNIDFTRKERAGVAAMAQLVPVLQGLVSTRNTTRALLGGAALPGQYQSARQATDAALSAFAQHLGSTGDPLALTEPLAKLRQSWAHTASATDGVDAQGRTVFGPVAEATVALLNRIGDDSNLVLDPDIDSFYTINALVLTLPRLIDDLGQVWGWSSFAAARGKVGNEAAARRFVGWASGVAVYSADLRSYVGRAVAANPALAAPLALDALQPMAAYAGAAEALAHGERQRNPVDQFNEGRRAVDSLFGLYQRALPALDGLLAQRIRKLEHERRLTLLMVAACLLLCGYLFEAFRREMAHGLALMTAQLGRMRRGDLTPGQAPPGRDEVVDVLHALDDMRLGLRGIVGQVRHAAHALLDGAATVSHGATDLSARTEANAAALEQTAASMEQIGVTVRHTAAHSQDAAALARRNAAVATEGGSLVQAVVATMNQVQQASDRIGNIIGTIDGIAFQTNILALNAAVEAARAGDHGKGFAVVASEVRSLARRSAAAAQEIKQLITGSLSSVADCTDRVQTAGLTMAELVGNADRINQLLAGIASGAAAQSTGIAHIGSAVQELDTSTQHNARLVQDTAGTAAGMRQQAERLAAEVARFQLDA